MIENDRQPLRKWAPPQFQFSYTSPLETAIDPLPSIISISTAKAGTFFRACIATCYLVIDYHQSTWKCLRNPMRSPNKKFKVIYFSGKELQVVGVKSRSGSLLEIWFYLPDGGHCLGVPKSVQVQGKFLWQVHMKHIKCVFEYNECTIYRSVKHLCIMILLGAWPSPRVLSMGLLDCQRGTFRVP